MAKVKPIPALPVIETHVGFTVEDLGCPGDSKRDWLYYSDLRPVPRDPKELIVREYEEAISCFSHCAVPSASKQASAQSVADITHRGVKMFPDEDLLVVGCTKIIETSQSSIRIQCISSVGLYRFSVRVRFKFGLRMSLLLSYVEVARLLRSSELGHHMTASEVESASNLFMLPPELREMIYRYVASGSQQLLPCRDNQLRLSRFSFVEGIGEPSGFYSNTVFMSSPLLLLSRCIRAEALPVVFQELPLSAPDIDALILALISIGDIGRANIRSISCYWESMSEMQSLWPTSPADGDPSLKLPRLHVSKLGCLLRQCPRLRLFRLYVSERRLERSSLESFKADDGIKELCSVSTIRKVDVLDYEHQPIESNELVEWFKANFERR